MPTKQVELSEDQIQQLELALHEQNPAARMKQAVAELNGVADQANPIAKAMLVVKKLFAPGTQPASPAPSLRPSVRTKPAARRRGKPVTTK